MYVRICQGVTGSLNNTCYFVLGICGKPRIIDVGGVPYLIPLVQLDKVR